MHKYVLTAVLFTAPLYAAAYDSDATPKQDSSKKQESVTYEQAFPNPAGKCSKPARKARQANPATKSHTGMSTAEEKPTNPRGETVPFQKEFSQAENHFRRISGGWISLGRISA